MASVAKELQALAGLLREGLITREEFDEQKALLFEGSPSASSTAPEPETPVGVSDQLTFVAPPEAGPDPESAPASAPASVSDAATAILSSDPKQEDSPPEAGPAALGPGLAPGSRVGRFELEAALDGGSLGQVWRARDTELGRTVALRLIGASSHLPAAKRVLSQGFAERDRIADRRHVLGFERPCTEQHRGTDVLVLPMEFADGGSFRTWLEEHQEQDRAQWLEEALDLFEQACRGVQAVHESGLQHLGLKPENLLIVGGRVKVADVGLSHDLSRLAAVAEDLLAEPSSLPTYVAPEQLLAMRPEDVGAEADLWALGAVLYELLDGAPPVGGHSADEVRRKLANPAMRVSYRKIPDRFEAVLRGCLEHDLARRTGSAAALLAALQSSRSAGSATEEPAGSEEAAATDEDGTADEAAAPSSTDKGVLSGWKALKARRARSAEEAAHLAEVQAARQEEARRQSRAEAEVQRRAREEAQAKREAAEETEAQRKIAEEAERRAALQTSRQEEARRQSRAEAEVQRKAREEAQAKRKASEEAQAKQPEPKVSSQETAAAPAPRPSFRQKLKDTLRPETPLEPRERQSDSSEVEEAGSKRALPGCGWILSPLSRVLARLSGEAKPSPLPPPDAGNSEPGARVPDITRRPERKSMGCGLVLFRLVGGQIWELEHRGHHLMLTRGPVLGERLYVDRKLADRHKTHIHPDELVAQIPGSDGATQTVRARVSKPFGSKARGWIAVGDEVLLDEGP